MKPRFTPPYQGESRNHQTCCSQFILSEKDEPLRRADPKTV
jgi:hypothetical protein